MQPTDDSVLLRQFAENHSDEAFAVLVNRHINLVYSVASRCVGDPHQAEEIAQAVFILLAKKAAQLRHDKALSSWLFQTTRLTASNFIRGETRRHRREQEAHMQSVLNEPGSDIWPRIAPLLDDAVAGLSEKDRQAIVLRFYEGRSLREVGAVLGASEAAAEKRVSRAVERLREFFSKRGVTVGASGLVVVISANAVQAAPVGLAVTISTAAALGGTTIAAITTATATKAIAMTITQKILITAVLAAAVGTGIYEARQISTLRTEVQNLQQQQSQLSAQNGQLIRERDDALRQAAARPDESQRFNINNSELMKLRAEVTRLRKESANLPKVKADETKEPVLSGEALEKQNASLLKSYFDLNPGVKIPEGDFAGEAQIAKSFHALAAKVAGFTDTTPQTQEDYRRAAAELRAMAEGQFAQNQLLAAVKKYRDANNKEFPTSVSELEPYFAKLGDDSALKIILDRYEIQPSSRFPNTPSKLLNTEWVITQKVLVDEEFDRRIYVGPDGFMQDLRRAKTQP